MKRKPRNTTKFANENPLAMLGLAMSEGASGMIENQEAAGQSDFVNSTTLPTKIMTDNGKEILEKAGVVFGEEVEDDPLFQYITLPEGWTREGTGHSMHSDVLDDKGRKRISVFYKAAFYDRKASCSLKWRYGHTLDYDRKDKEDLLVRQITDCGKVIHEMPPLTIGNNDKKWEVSERAEQLARKWLDCNYPAWTDPAAYWD